MNPKTFECSSSVLDPIIDHVNSVTDSEVGGVLVGKHEGGVTTITASIPAHSATTGSANVTFTHEVWEEVLPVIDADHPNEQLIGWYHSHPGFGVFLSEYDLFIHRNFFQDSSMVALVIDPLKGEGGWFEWRGESIDLTTTFSTPKVQSAHASAALDVRTRSNRRNTLVIGGAALTLVALILGYVLGGALAPSETSAVRKAEQAEIDRLQSELNRANEEANATGEVMLFESCSFQYSVRAGDGFWLIAQRYLGDGAKASDLKRLNPDLVEKGLDPGDKLKIPVAGCEPAEGEVR